MPGSSSFWIEPFLDLAKTIYSQPQEHWIDDSPRLQDTELLEREASGSSAIDEINLRAEMLQLWRTKGSGVVLKIRELPGRTRVVFLGTEEQWAQAPWDLWARIFQGIGHPVGYTLWYAHPSTRQFPEHSLPVEAKHINGGYGYICEKKLVVVYRYEEATRVLLHELLHTACFDGEKPVEELEAFTEAWTELFLCAILSRGKPAVFKRLWGQQLSWIYRQVDALRQRHNVFSRTDYAWRYITGKLEVLESKGFLLNFPQTASVPLNLRFTTPEWDTLV